MLDRAAIGRVLPPVTATVERGRLRFFLNAIGETSPIHHDTAAAQAAGYRDCPIPPTYLFCLRMLDAPEPYALLDELGVDLGTVLHGEQSFTYHEPVVAGDEIRFLGRIADIFDRKGGALEFLVEEIRVERVSDGAHVADVRQVTVIRNPVAGGAA